MNTADLYNALLLNDDTGKKAKLLLLQTHWFTVNAIFDPRSGEALPQPLTSFCKNMLCICEITELNIKSSINRKAICHKLELAIIISLSRCRRDD